LIPSRKTSANPIGPSGAVINTNNMLGISPGPRNIPLPPSPAIPILEVDEEYDEEHTRPINGLSPSSTQRFDDLKKTLGELEDKAPDGESQAKVDVLLRSVSKLVTDAKKLTLQRDGRERVFSAGHH
jgi:hypothetical protein